MKYTRARTSDLQRADTLHASALLATTHPQFFELRGRSSRACVLEPALSFRRANVHQMPACL